MAIEVTTKIVHIRQDPIEERPDYVPFNPKEIIWCRYDFDVENGPAANVRQLEISNEMYCYPIPAAADPAAFAKDFAASVALGLNPDPANKLPYLDPLLYKPTDVGVTQQCYVIIELKQDRNWRFINTDGGLTTDGAYHPANCTLRHVASDGSSAYKVYPDDCRVVYFELVARDRASYPKANHKFNYHIEMINGDILSARTYAIGVIVDPDIGNTGNQPIP